MLPILFLKVFRLPAVLSACPCALMFCCFPVVGLCRSQFRLVSGLPRGDLDKWLPYAKLRGALLYSEVTKLKHLSKVKMIDAVATHARSASGGSTVSGKSVAQTPGGRLAGDAASAGGAHGDSPAARRPSFGTGDSSAQTPASRGGAGGEATATPSHAHGHSVSLSTPRDPAHSVHAV